MQHIFSKTISALLIVLAQVVQPALAQGAPADGVTVVIQINLKSGVQAQTAVAPMNDMRNMIKAQPGYVGGESLRNNNPSNAPAFVHVLRWASLKYWENVYASPEFAKLTAAGAKQYDVVVSAYKTVN